MHTKSLLLLLPFLFLLSLPAHAAADKLPAGTLSAEEVQALLQDRTVNTITANKGWLAVSYYAADGTLRQMRRGERWSGSWRVSKGGRLCLQLEGMREKCRIIVKEGETYKKYVVKKNGRHQHTLTYLSFSAGNPYGL